MLFIKIFNLRKFEKKASGLAKKNVAVEKQAKQINDFVNTFVDKNITNYRC
jgi:hypothetical protein